MYWRLRRKTRARFRRGAMALLLAANHLVVALGAPLPMPSLSAGLPKSAHEMFPCMICPCGCRTAEQCWRHCCCYTMTQKLAWAKEHGVEPPDFVRAAAEKEAESAAMSAKPKRCCPHCHQNEPAAQDAAAPAETNPARAKTSPASLRQETSKRQAIVLIKALQCQGFSGAGVLTSLPAVFPPAVSFSPTAPPAMDAIAFTTPLLPDVVILVPEPPPRASRQFSIPG